MTSLEIKLTGERADILETLRAHRHFLRFTARDLTEEQARQRTTVSELTIGGLIKHVATVESRWRQFIAEGPRAMEFDGDYESWADNFTLSDTETLAGVLAWYDDVAKDTDELVATVDLDLTHPLPEAPWFEAGATRSARRVLTHIAGETAQHCGHADIIRESLDGQRTMG